MTQAVFKNTEFSLTKLLEDIDYGDIALPDIQRQFVWKPVKVRDLFDSMFRGFPIGYLLFWSNDHLQDSRTIGIEDKRQKVPRLLIVDGQQRLTSLYAVMRRKPVLDSSFRPLQIRIAFHPSTATFEVSDAAIQRDPQWLADISEIWTSDAAYSFIDQFLRTCDPQNSLDPSERRIIVSNLERLFNLRDYTFSALEISSTVTEEAVADIFVRINSRGERLNQADFILTLMSVFWEQGRKELESFARACKTPPDGRTHSSPFNYLIAPQPEQMLRVGVGLGFQRARLRDVYNLLRGKDMTTGEVSPRKREDQFTVMEEAQAYALDHMNWHNFLKAIEQSGYKSRDLITSETTVLYSYVLYVLGRKRYAVKEPLLSTTIARWFSMASLTSRYTASPESAFDGDLARLRSVSSGQEFVDTLNRIIQDVLTNDFWSITLVNNLETSSARSPALNAYYAALISLRAAALFSRKMVADLFNPSYALRKKSLEKHHLFPQAYLRDHGTHDVTLINQAANMTLVEYADNIAIGERAPADYFSEFLQRVPKGEQAEMCRLHAIPLGVEVMDYRSFLGERRKLMAAIVREAFERL